MPFDTRARSKSLPSPRSTPRPEDGLDASALPPEHLLSSLELGDAPVAPPPTVHQELERAAGVPLDPEDGAAIPQHIHRFWSGGPLSREAMANLAESSGKTQDTDWQQTLWHSSTMERQFDEAGVFGEEQQVYRDLQRETLAGLGYNLRSIEELLVENERPAKKLGPITLDRGVQRERGSVTHQDMEVMSGKALAKHGRGGDDRWDGVKHLSDMARLIYLKEEGGHHLDVDMGLGAMDLSRGYKHNDPDGRVPLMGSLTATNDDHDVVPHLRRVAPETRDMSNLLTAQSAGVLGTRAKEMSGMLNGQIASQPGTEHLTQAVEEFRAEAVPGEGELPSGMIFNRTLLTGGEALDGPGMDRARGLTVPPYLLDLQHLTAESDNR